MATFGLPMRPPNGVSGKDDAIAAAFDLDVAAFFHFLAAAQTFSHGALLLSFQDNVYLSNTTILVSQARDCLSLQNTRRSERHRAGICLQ